MTIAILWPTFMLVGLIFAMWFWMFVKRFGHIKANPPGADDFANGDAAMRYFRPVEMPANNLRNLFEMPVLFFALMPLLLIFRHAGHVQVVLAWAYVLLRVLHSVAHINVRTSPIPRLIPYLLSCAVLLAMWIGFAVDMISAQTAYDAAMENITAI